MMRRRDPLDSSATSARATFEVNVTQFNGKHVVNLCRNVISQVFALIAVFFVTGYVAVHAVLPRDGRKHPLLVRIVSTRRFVFLKQDWPLRRLRSPDDPAEASLAAITASPSMLPNERLYQQLLMSEDPDETSDGK